jgi:hypothetical protein
MLIVSCKGIFVKSDSTSKDAMKRLLAEGTLEISAANEYEFSTVYWLVVKGASKGTRNLAKEYEAVLYAAKIGRNGNSLEKSDL